MTALASITLENEMDLTLAYKKSIQVASCLNLTMATQTVFATAVSEVCREVIDKAFDGLASIGVVQEGGRYFIHALIVFRVEADFQFPNVGFEYARKLIPSFDIQSGDKSGYRIRLKLAIPASAKLDAARLLDVKKRLEDEGPISAYEELKLKNAALHHENLQREQELDHARILNDQKTEFLSVASHELNTPLTVLRMLAQIAVSLDNGGNSTLTEHLIKLDVQTAKLARLTQQLFDISKMEAGRFDYSMEEVPFDSYISEIAESARLLVPNHPIGLHLAAAGTEVLIDKMRMEQVVNNVINNAAKYSLEGKPISIRTSCEDGHIRLFIEDEGIGMNAETRQRVFQKFYRGEEVQRKYNGLGMGLYIASRIVADHNGVIEVESSPNAGTTLCIVLPVLQPAQAN